MDEHLAGFYRIRLAAGANRALAGADDEEFPLREVRVIWANRRAPWDPANLQVKRVAAVRQAAVANAPRAREMFWQKE